MTQPQANNPRRLSVVIAAHDAVGVIGPCLTALELQRETTDFEVIVADSSQDRTDRVVAERFPWVRLLHFAEPLTVPTLRGRAIAAATGDIIAVLDPYSVAAPDWARNVVLTHAQCPNLGIGGAVGLDQPESRSLWEWTLYFNEYGLFMPPIRQGPAWIVPGSNVSYKRAALFDGDRPRYPIFWKTFVNQDIERAGEPLWLAPDVVVSLNKPIPFAEFLRTRYHHGRCFAGMRMRDVSLLRRAVHAGGTVLLPLLLQWRWLHGFWPKRARRVRFLLTVPMQLLLFAVWSWGEACGDLRGPGRCCDELFY